ncbi:zinc-dependent metalloprotease [Helcobacillus massiliensis]|uniref:Putative hydrolase n=1 Tax=Helcobacillus massiliensis TaxID=521392 RepID=A0A839QZD9_9MICO|nr:zinc-dependent metalloprotease [Helcobacillus massiliensis]MBB3022757.1 putative hydrolase [Helcobacillus massiliensis]
MTSSSGSDEENLRKFLEEVFGGQLPPGALEGMDLTELAKGAGLPSDPAMLQAAAAQMQSLFASGGDEPVNWKLAQDLARQVASGSVTMVPGHALPPTGGSQIGTDGDPSVTPEAQHALDEAATIARLWLQQVVDVDVPAAPLQAWTRGTWVNRTIPRWQKVVEPVAEYMAGAIGDALGKQMEQMQSMPGMEGLGAMGMGDPRAMMRMMGGTMFGMQFGHAIGSLAREQLGTTDLSLPLWDSSAPVLIPANLDDLLADSDLDPSAARIFFAAREIAHVTLFRSAPWLPEHLFTAIEGYARGIELDLSSLEEKMRDVDVSDPIAMSALNPEDMFTFTRSERQERALTELTTTLALIESWVDHVVTHALEGKLPRLDAMRELVRRRRATGGQAEQMLANLVGIELRPRSISEAYDWWQSVLDTEGAAGREKVWAHPDLLPSPEVLSGQPQAPKADAAEQPAEAAADFDADFDEELRRLLDGELPEAPKEDGDGDGDDDGDGDGDEPGPAPAA